MRVIAHLVVLDPFGRPPDQRATPGPVILVVIVLAANDVFGEAVARHVLGPDTHQQRVVDQRLVDHGLVGLAVVDTGAGAHRGGELRPRPVWLSYQRADWQSTRLNSIHPT